MLNKKELESQVFNHFSSVLDYETLQAPFGLPVDLHKPML